MNDRLMRSETASDLKVPESWCVMMGSMGLKLPFELSWPRPPRHGRSSASVRPRRKASRRIPGWSTIKRPLANGGGLVAIELKAGVHRAAAGGLCHITAKEPRARARGSVARPAVPATARRRSRHRSAGLAPGTAAREVGALGQTRAHDSPYAQGSDVATASIPA